MPEINCNITLDENNKKISINNISADSIEIDCSADVDLSALVKKLSEQIDSGGNIVTTEVDITSEDEKIKLVLSTIKEVIDKYNEVINQEPVINDEDDLFF